MRLEASASLAVAKLCFDDRVQTGQAPVDPFVDTADYGKRCKRSNPEQREAQRSPQETLHKLSKRTWAAAVANESHEKFALEI